MVEDVAFVVNSCYNCSLRTYIIVKKKKKKNGV